MFTWGLGFALMQLFVCGFRFVCLGVYKLFGSVCVLGSLVVLN